VLEPGSVVGGKLRVERILGQGGMGVVVVATHLDLDQLVAVKVVHDEIARDPEVVERFLREARACARLRSEHVCKVQDFGRLESGAPYLVMELLDGHDLGSVIEAARLPTTVAAEYVLQACVGIAEAHAAGVIHRDLKPKNLFVTQRLDDTPLIKVLDFGIAKAPTKAEAQLTKTTTVIGSPGYMSPEQLRSARDVDVRSDIWSLGVILYECVAGKLPFASDTLMELAVKIAMDPPTPLGPEVDPRYAAIVMRCLEKTADRRFANVGDLAGELASLIGPSAAGTRDLVTKLIAARSTAQATAAAIPSGLAAAAATNLAPVVQDSSVRGVAVVQETNMTTGPSASTGAVVGGDGTIATPTTPPPLDVARTELAESPPDADARPPRRRSRAAVIAVLVAIPVLAAAAYVAMSQQSSTPPHHKHPAQSNDVSVLPPDAAEVSVPAADANASVVHVDAASAARGDALVAIADAAATHIDAGAPARADAGASVVATVDAGHTVDAAVVVVADANRMVDAGEPAGETKNEVAKADAAKARDAMARQDWPGALAAAEAGLRAEPNNYNLHELAARAACRAGKPEVARNHAAGLIPRDRRNVLRACLNDRNHGADGEDDR
jgi:hypothetical protein